MRQLRALLVVAVVGIAGCGDRGASVTTGTGDPPRTGHRADAIRYTTTATVLESPQHGPQLCLGGVATSLPPQCGGPDVIGWDWDTVDGEQSTGGTTWGDYTVVGTWDGSAFTLTEPPATPAPSDRPPPAGVDFRSPCSPPEGGWRAVDPSKTDDEAMTAAIDHARSRPGFGGAWIDQSINPAAGSDPVDEGSMNDPNRLILNLTFTDDLAAHEAAVRRIWGGALCISKARFSADELSRIRAAVEGEVDLLLYSSIDEVNGRVQIAVPVDDGLQARFDARYGEGAVEVEPRLRPVEG